MTTLTRRYAFSASHRLHSPQLSAEENERVYGKCNNPFGHGHNYVLEVTASGAVDPETGVLVPVPELDRLVNEEILTRFAYANMNTDIPQFSELVPTTENLALVIAELLEANWSAYLANSRARLHRVRIEETGRNRFEFLLGSWPISWLAQREKRDANHSCLKLNPSQNPTRQKEPVRSSTSSRKPRRSPSPRT